MENKVRVEIDLSLKKVLEEVQKQIAEDVKKKWNLKEITICGTVASQFIASCHNGKKPISFKIRKISLTQGVLEII